MEHISILTTRILLTGDFNIHIERTDDVYAIGLLEVFNMFQMVNHVNGSIHNFGETLDLHVSSLGFSVQIIRPSIHQPIHQISTSPKNKFMRSESILKAAAITKYISKLIINFNSKTFTNSKRGSKVMWDQVNKIRGSDKSFKTSTSQQIDANTLNTQFASMSTDPFYKTPPTKAKTIISRHQHQQFISYSVMHILTMTCPSGTGPDGLPACLRGIKLLFDITESLIISRIKYAAPSWFGFTTHQQLQSFIKKTNPL
ncbi:hypothetical protein HELRODRAFT_174248 [Helobdella robusta]|uniref:Endonuclease/exonuclease/phosphatase domain-containing protein n=1 Tax=Helobdella robusta TaxID=6412 RepID=T1F7V7_HELRO|nr:hypothetical protein HELRODRAFT_174248 [Helobdella robusta]ESO02824.1 hypothetical protein HELRODRAFT_174248 [Helobdella robusta]